MEFTWDFIRMFSIGLFYAAPLSATLVLLIVVLGHVLGRLVGWSTFDALYHAFVAATTLGYGDLHPCRKRSKFLAIAIAFVGIIFTRYPGCHCASLSGPRLQGNARRR
jgi:voltage-gated potassium channel